MGKALRILSPILRNQAICETFPSEHFSDFPQKSTNKWSRISIHLMGAYPNQTFHPAEKVLREQGISCWANFIRFLQKNLRYEPLLVLQNADFNSALYPKGLIEDYKLLSAFGAVNEHIFSESSLEPLTASEIRNMREATVNYFGQDLVIVRKSQNGLQVAFKGTLRPIQIGGWEFAISNIINEKRPLISSGKIPQDGAILLENKVFPCLLRISHPRFEKIEICVSREPSWKAFLPLRVRPGLDHRRIRSPSERLQNLNILKGRLKKIFETIRNKPLETNSEMISLPSNSNSQKIEELPKKDFAKASIKTESGSIEKIRSQPKIWDPKNRILELKRRLREVQHKVVPADGTSQAKENFFDLTSLINSSINSITPNVLGKNQFSSKKDEVSGRVLDAITKEPLTGAQVLIGHNICGVDSQGTFSLKSFQTNKIVEILAASPGYESLAMKCKVGFKKGPLNIFLKPYKPRLNAKIISSSTGDPIKNVNFSINSRVYNSDGEGKLVIKGLKPGYYKVDFSAPGYNGGSELALIEETETNHTFKLQPQM